MSNCKINSDLAKENPIVWEGDVVVCGGGPAGVIAALASAKTGAKTLIVERYGFFGGAGVNSLMFWFTTFTNGERLIIEGLPLEFSREYLGVSGFKKNRWLQFDTELYKIAAIKAFKDYGCEMLVHTWGSELILDESKVKGVILQNKSGRVSVKADVVIDATGDGDLIPSSSCDFFVGRNKDGLCLPMSSVFQMANVDVEKYNKFKKQEKNESGCDLQNIWLKGQQQGELDNIPLDGFIHLNHIRHDMFNVHATRVLKKTSVDGWEFSEAQIDSYEQAWKVSEFLIKRVPGFEKSFMYNSAAQIGIREGRRLEGAYILNDEDVLNARKFEDVIACGCYNIDLHNPSANNTVHIPVPKGDWYEIPFRCLYTDKISGFLTAGRCISGTHEAHGSYRGQSHAMALGHAAGCAAALASQHNIAPHNLKIDKLQKVLKNQKAFLGSKNDIC